MNAYYDYRKTSRQHYNQVGLGIEALGRIWDFRLNGYLPVGDTESNWYDRKFKNFEGHYMYVSRKKEISLGGVNAEAGIHINEFGKSRTRNTYNSKPHLYIAAGPYYLNGEGKSTWGGQARIALDIYDCIRLEANTSYDELYHGVGQGQISLMFSLGKKKKVVPKEGQSCQRAQMLSERMVQRVDRFEIIPTDHKREKDLAIDPVTGQPYFFWFVDNTSHSAGTYESPFPTLLMAQNASSANDVIYVFPGDGTDTGMDVGIQLKNNQKLYGSSTTHLMNTTVGSVVIPAMTTGLPLITNATNAAVRTAANNEIAGLSLRGVGSQSGVRIFNTIGNLKIRDSVITSDGTDAIFLAAQNGSMTIDNTTITGHQNGFRSPTAGNLDSIVVRNSTINGSLNHGFFYNSGVIGTIEIYDSTITGQINGVLLAVDLNLKAVTVEGCTLTGVTNEAMSIFDTNSVAGPSGALINISNNELFGGRNGFDFVDNSGAATVNLSNNIILAGTAMAGGGINIVTEGQLVAVNISDCQVTTATGKGINFDTINASSPCTINNCIITTSVAPGVFFTHTPIGSSTFTLNLLNNVASGFSPSYSITNSGAGTFYLHRENNSGAFSLTGVTIIP